MFLVTAAEMRECDRRMIEEAGTPGPVLMERAALGIVRAIRRHYPHLNRRRVWIVCGRGNNGGDGLVVARLLHDAGYNPRLFLTDPAEAASPDAARQIGPLRMRNLPLEPIRSDRLREIEALSADDLLLDGIFGTGFRGALRAEKATLVTSMNRSAARRIAIDIPSGLSADSGCVEGPAFRAERTFTMASPKRSFLFWPARSYVGTWEVIDIGTDPAVEAKVDPVARLIRAADLAMRIEPFVPDAHKGTRGKVLIAGGSPGLTGAVCLAAEGAAAAGAGLVRAAVPRSVNAICEMKLTEPMTFPVAETAAGTIDGQAGSFLLGLAGRWDALVLGPGLGRHRTTDRLVRSLYSRWPGRLIVDADGLNSLSEGRFPRRGGSLPAAVLTPHPGEMARLTRSSVEEVLADRIASARSFAEEQGVILLLKGAPTVISDPKGRILVNPTGNPGLATGGSGDVLSGIVGTLLAQGIDPFWAAGAAAFLHGRSADRISERISPRSIRPSDVVCAMGEIWRELEGTSGGS